MNVQLSELGSDYVRRAELDHALKSNRGKPIVIGLLVLAALCSTSYAPPLPTSVPPWPSVVDVKASNLPEALRTIRHGQTLNVIGGGSVAIPEIFVVSGRRGIRIVAVEPVTIVGGQLTFSGCVDVVFENFRLYPHGNRTPGQVAEYVRRTRGFDGRALVISTCRNVTIRHCTFAACTDDMAGPLGECEGILFDRCMFALPLGVWGQGFLGTRLPPVSNWLALRECVFAGCWYRAPKLEGGEFAVQRCIMAGMHYRPIELREPRGEFVGCWFAPMTSCDARPIILGGGLSAGLRLAGNRLYGEPAGWDRLVGMPGRSPIDLQNRVKMSPLDSESSDVADSPSMLDVLLAAGTRGDQDEIERWARWYVVEVAK